MLMATHERRPVTMTARMVRRSAAAQSIKEPGMLDKTCGVTTAIEVRRRAHSRRAKC